MRIIKISGITKEEIDHFVEPFENPDESIKYRRKYALNIGAIPFVNGVYTVPGNIAQKTQALNAALTEKS